MKSLELENFYKRLAVGEYVEKGQTAVIITNIYHVEEGMREYLGSLISEQDLDNLLLLYISEGTKITAQDSGSISDISWLSEDGQDFTVSENWIKLD